MYRQLLGFIINDLARAGHIKAAVWVWRIFSKFDLQYQYALWNARMNKQ